MSDSLKSVYTESRNKNIVEMLLYPHTVPLQKKKKQIY